MSRRPAMVRLAKIRKRSAEDWFAIQIRVAKLPQPERQCLPALELGRHWRVDFAWPEQRLAVEIEEDVHQIHERAVEDTLRTLALQALGWRVVKFHHKMVGSGLALLYLRGLLAENPPALVAALVKHGAFKASRRG
jgi:hypothetical protein